MEDIRLVIEQVLEEIGDAIDNGEIDAEEVERLFLDMLNN